MFKHIADALVAYGPAGLFLIGLLDSMGIPLPAAMDALLIAYAIESPERAYFAVAVAIAGSLAGNLILFRAARLGGRRFLAETSPRQQKFRLWFQRYGLMTIFIPAVVPFVPLPLKVFVVCAGVMHTRFARFLLVILAARVMRYFGIAYLGIRLGHDAKGFLQHNAWNIAGILLLMALLLVWAIKWNDRRTSANNAASSP